MSEQQEPQERIAIREFEKISMFTPTPGAEGKRAKLAWGIRDGSPRVTVFTNDPADSINKGIISAPMDPITFEAFLTRFEKMIRGAGEDKDKLQCFQTKYENGNRTNERVLQSELLYGKDANGICWISVIAPDRPKIRFDFKMSDWHKLFTKTGEPAPDAEGSSLVAMATVVVLRRVTGHALNMILDNPTPKPPRDGQGGQRNGGGGGNYQRNSAPPVDRDPVLDDLPFYSDHPLSPAAIR